jgi:hypothetical protein
LRTLLKENELNKLIKDQRTRGNREFILFTSLWDTVSNNVLEAIKNKPPKVPVSVVNSFDTPHSFVIWGVKKTPCLVVLEGRGSDKRLTVTDHVTDIYKRLRLEK